MKLLRTILIPFLLLFAGILGMSLLEICQFAVRHRNTQIFLVALVGFCILFIWKRFTPLYVFAHEMTHWLAAKATGHETGRISISWSKGYVEIKNPSVFIVLAPYFVPLYFLIVVGLAGLIMWFFPAYWPAWADIGVMVASAAALAYHLILTCVALWRGQSDLDKFGVYFSLSLVLLVNLALIYAVAVVYTGRWYAAWALPWDYFREFYKLLRAL